MEYPLLLAKKAAAISLTPLTFPIFPAQRIYWLYLLSALTLAIAVYLLRGRARHKFSLGGLFRFCFPGDIYLHPSSLLDYRFFLLNTILKVLSLGLFAIQAGFIIALTAHGLEILGLTAHPVLPGGVLGSLCYTILSLILLDLGIFLSHWMQHRFWFLWEFHKVHHSAQRLNPITVYRMHPIDTLLSNFLTAVLMGVGAGLWLFWSTGGVSVFMVYGLNIGVFLFYLSGNPLRHTQIWLPYTGWLGRVLVSPAHHQIHHSTDAAHFNKNLGFIFAFWDIAAGSFVMPEKQDQNLNYGIGHGEDAAYSSVWQLYMLPFVKVGRGIKAAFSGPDSNQDVEQ